MRLKNLLTFLVLLSVSLGMRAADISGTGISGATDNSSGKKVQTLNIKTPGALATWVAAHTDNYDTNNPYQGLGGSNDFYSLKISGKLNADDLAALNSTTCAAFSRFPRIDMSEVTLEEGTTSKNVCSVVFGPASFQKNNETITGNGATFIVLPNGITSADDVTLMGKMKAKGNSALKVVGAFDGSDTTLPELALYSFQENELSNFSSQMMNLESVAMVARLAGNYGDKDLYNNGKVFGWTPPCIWDFTGASFSSITTDVTVNREYYAYNDPFCEGGQSKPSNNYQTNSFFYFSYYSTQVVDIKLPTGITVLPPLCLNDLGAENVKLDAHKAAYKAYYGVTDADLAELKPIGQANGAIIPSLTIPDNYIKLDYECGNAAHIKHLLIGGGVKIVEGGAFYDCLNLEDLDFGSGLSNCYLGDRAFHGEENSLMKHIALSEGIVSLGFECFKNAQQLESIRLPQSLIDMGNHCFDNCLALNSITIPENVEKIGQAAFNLCPFTDIYLTTTDPAKIPEVWSAGTNFLAFDGNCTFHHGHLDGWEGGVDAYADKINNKMTWEEAAEFYFINWNGMPVLHFPKELAEKVRSEISGQYALKTKADEDGNQYGLPLRVDMDRRDDIPGADLGSSGTGKYTQDGWAQFMMMKEFTTKPGGDVYPKDYEDVWYTMCFPFDLTDEQLAAAFNETFNIVDFSGVEVTEETETEPLTLTLHFNTVAQTTYKDNNGSIYIRKMDGDSPVREKHDNFKYNVYYKVGENGVVDYNKEYHHVHVSGQLVSNKTKTFAPVSQASDLTGQDLSDVVEIDGVLATAGHPYMIHPAIGTSIGNPQRCDFSGIEWKPMTEWAEIFEAQKRVVDLGVQKGSFTGDDIHDHSKWTPDADNYMQPAYSKYAGQTYTFIGNSKEYRDDAQAAIGNDTPVPDEPVFPVVPDQPTETLTKPTETLTKPTPLTDEEQALVLKLTEGNGEYNRGPWYGITEEITANFNDGSSPQWNSYVSAFHIFSSLLNAKGWECYNGNGGKDAETAFNYCKTTFNKSISYESDYAAYLANQALWDAYNANQAAWDKYNSWNQATEEAEYNRLLGVYNAAKEAHNTWLENAKKWKTYIPKNAYFLGRKGTAYPKYYREIAENPADGQPSTRQGGVWTQFTAVIIPNDAAINGIEKKLGAGIANNTKALNMVFDEGFMGEFDPTEIKDIVAEAEEKGQKVEFMNIVYNINGEVVGRGSHSLSNLPQGMYIINGKKYLVK